MGCFLTFALRNFGRMMSIRIKGIVTGGKRLGRKLGFPTANIILPADTDIKEGVYAALATVDGRVYESMANVGGRNKLPGAPENPNLQQGSPILEVNIFDFDGDLYDRTIEVELKAHIREERKFASLEELKETVDNDRHTIKEYFKTNKSC